MTVPTMEFETLLSSLEILQKMVDLQIHSLRELKEKKESKSDLIWKERSDLEGKLMKFFAKQIVAKINFGPGIAQFEAKVQEYPQLNQLLFVVDIADDMVQAVTERCSSVEELCLFTDEKINGIFYSHDDDKELSQRLYAQNRRLRIALKILRSYVERLQNGEKTSDLVWNSWFETVPDSPSPNIRASIASYLSVFSYSPTSEEILRSQSLAFSPSISRSIPPSPSATRTQTIPRSRSDEHNVGQRIQTESTSSAGSSGSSTKYKISTSGSDKKRPVNLIITPSADTETDSDYSKSRSSSMSQSPRTPNANWNFSMLHSIKHRYTNKQLLVSIACDYCNRIMFIGLKCKECGFKCHKKCSRKAPASCGLPPQMEKIFRKAVQNEGKVEGLHTIKRTNSEPSDFIHQVIKHKRLPIHRSHGNLPHKDPTFSKSTQSADSYSTTSSNSSMSSSSYQSESPLGTPDINTANLNIDYIDERTRDKFYFPEQHMDGESPNFHDTLTSTISTISTIKSDASTDTLTMTEESEKSKSSSDTKSSLSTISGQEELACPIDELDTQISDVIPQHVRLRDRGSLMSEWVIPYQDIEVGELMGTGRVGKVFKAKWHGEVALKVLYLENPTADEKRNFKYKVQVLRRTRHENLILFMGACFEPPTLAIVCSFCKGYTLYQHIHIFGNKFEDTKLISIIQQISQGMSYLHAKGIVHCDLKSKNVFLENNKVIITDFGFLSVADVKVTNSNIPGKLFIQKGWLCYQAPEIVRLLDPSSPGIEVAMYDKRTDVYAFGCIWFELLAGMWPFDGLPIEAILWQIGKGYKQQLNGIEISREAKDILSVIWAFNPDDRPAFQMLLKAFERLPKRKLIRSPSQPTYLTRAANALLI